MGHRNYGAYIYMRYSIFCSVYTGSHLDRKNSKPSDGFAFAENPEYTYTVYSDKSVLASEERVFIDSGVSYIVFKSKSDFIVKKYCDEYYKTGYISLPQEKEQWDANEVLKNDDGDRLVIIYDNAIIDVTPIDFTEEQKADIASKLNG